MNTKFTILVAAGLLIAGVSQAQGTVAANDVAFNNPRHTVVMRNHKERELMNFRHEIRKDRKEIGRDRHKIQHHRKQMRHHHKVMKHHHRKF